MIRRLRRAEIAGRQVVIFKPRIDDRYDAADIVSHAGARMRAVPISSVAELVARGKGFDVVGIDEVQFLEPAIVPAALELGDGGTRVVVAGLDQDFRLLPFGPIPELLSHAEFVDKLQAVCHRCGGPATTTQRLLDGRPAATRPGPMPPSPRQRPRRAPALSATQKTAAATRTIEPPGGRSA